MSAAFFISGVTIQHHQSQRQKMLCFAPALKVDSAISAFAPFRVWGKQRQKMRSSIDAE
ncbi:MAG: hypothetical protein H6558_10690 [Lewinellaceae bacterium]|nr:hypothetical protein [Lewinellaceae bacterium]